MNLTFILIFWLIIQIFSLVGLAISFRLFHNLPDRGYAFAKVLGLLLTGYTLWLLSTFGLLRNNLGGSLLAMILVVILGIVWYRQQAGPAMVTWLKANTRYVATVELLFAVALITWTFYKAHNPNIETAGGEKWMEIAFINANLLSPNFPPQDPWLSGFGISYYYFGYVIMAMLIRLSGIVSTTAFNLLIPTLLGLTLIGAFGVVTNMVAVQQNAAKPTSAAIGTGLLGALFVGLMGHLEGVLEVLHARGLLSPAFWRWLDIRDLKEPLESSGSWVPDRFIWWWRGSRVLTDYDLAGREQEVIDEIPAFSFLLGDVHPHVLALPFVLLAVGLAFQLVLRPKIEQLSSTDQVSDSQSMLSLASRSLNSIRTATGGWAGFFIYALVFGSLGFLNTWDFPIYLALLGLAYLIWRGSSSLTESVLGMGILAIAGILLYLPFYVGFQSQADGILPNLWNPTRLPQFLVLFGTFLVAAIGFLIVLSKRNPAAWRHNFRWTLPLAVWGPVALLLLLAIPFLVLPSARSFIDGILANPDVQTAINGATQSELLREIIRRRVGNPWTFLLLGSLVGWLLAHFWSSVQLLRTDDKEDGPGLSRSEQFGIVLFMMGLLLPLSVEFVFLRDNFVTRMNTIFKFYFQAWVLLGLGAAFAVYYVRQSLRGVGRGGWQVLIAFLVLLGLVYPVLATFNKANNFRGEATLDGIAWIKQIYPDDYAAILWLRENAAPDAVLLEAPGASFVSYRYEGRISALTGRPALLGWGGHQSQWRGNYDEPGRREPDIDMLYNGLDIGTTLTLLDKYDINYVYVGPLERQRYSANGLAKFNAIMDVAFTQGQVTIYQRSVQELGRNN